MFVYLVTPFDYQFDTWICANESKMRQGGKI
jgi:hypothetical protein